MKSCQCLGRNILLFSVLLAGFVSLPSCEKNEPVPAAVSPTPKAHPIVGEWEWKVTYNRGVYTPANTGVNKRYVFDIKDSVTTFLNGSFYQRQHYEFRRHKWDMYTDSVEVIFIDALPFNDTIYSDTLVLEAQMNDGGTHYYLRINK